MMIEDQQILVNSLINSNLYNHPTQKIEVIETHISWVILTGQYAYKIKKSLDLGFLNFSSLSKRQYYCNAELELNKRLAPDYYLDVIPITGSPGNPELNGKGDVIEYALKMRQFPQENQLDRELSVGNVSEYSMNIIAEKIFEFHQKIDVANNTQEYGNPQNIHQPVLDCYAEIIKHLSNEEDIRRVTLLQDWSCTEFERLEKIFSSRKENGFIRECHGDLHLRNIAIVKSEVVVFDCIEFNDNLRWNDLMSELAFLIMDLDDHQRADLGNCFLNRYLELSGDYSGLKILNYYLVYRSVVRAMVSGIRITQNNTKAGRDTEYSEFANYLALAEKYTRTSLPRLFITHGLSGSGKTTVSKVLMQELSAIRIRSDIERKRYYDLSETHRGHQDIGHGIYNVNATHKTYELIYDLADQILDAGYSVIVDATFLKLEYRELFQKLAKSRGIEFRIFHCFAPIEELHRRIVLRSQANVDVSDADNKVLDSQIQQDEKFTGEEQKYLISINTEEKISAQALRSQI